MAVITKILLCLGLVYAISCIPIDEASTKTTIASSVDIAGAEQVGHEKKEIKKEVSSEESKESDSQESSEEVKKRPTRHTDSSGESVHHTKHETTHVDNSPKIANGMAASQPQLPARETRSTDNIQHPPSTVHHATEIKTKETGSKVNTPTNKGTSN